MKKVSVAITAYNQANYIGQAVESVLSQDYPNLEVVVSDNASTDEIGSVIDPFRSGDSAGNGHRRPIREIHATAGLIEAGRDG